MKSLVYRSLILISSAAFCAQIAAAATYEVPNDGAEPNPLFDIDSFNIQQQGSQLAISYNIPLALTGQPNAIFMTGKIGADNKAPVKGPLVDGICEMTTSTCNVMYHDLSIDPAKVTGVLQAMNLPKAEFDSRLAASFRFSGDPIGVIRFQAFKRRK